MNDPALSLRTLAARVARRLLGAQWRRAVPGARAAPPATAEVAAAAGDHHGPLPPIRYSPNADGLPDAGEVIWAWVPYQEDRRRGKDRPVLVIARTADAVLACPMTSKDHDRDAAQEASQGRYWVDVGAGAWDSRGRASEVGVHRVVRLPMSAIRREGAVLARERFEEVAAALRARHAGG